MTMLSRIIQRQQDHVKTERAPRMRRSVWSKVVSTFACCGSSRGVDDVAEQSTENVRQTSQLSARQVTKRGSQQRSSCRAGTPGKITPTQTQNIHNSRGDARPTLMVSARGTSSSSTSYNTNVSKRIPAISIGEPRPPNAGGAQLQQQETRSTAYSGYYSPPPRRMSLPQSLNVLNGQSPLGCDSSSSNIQRVVSEPTRSQNNVRTPDIQSTLSGKYLSRLRILFPGCKVIPPSDLEPVLNRRNEQKILGGGAFGEVHLMRQKSKKGRLCAVKVFKGDHGHKTIYREAKVEVDAMTRLRGLDCVSALYGITPNENNDGAPSLVLEFIGDEKTFKTTNLYDALAAKVLTKSALYRVSVDIVKAVQGMSSRGVFHCDLKIDNIMITPGSIRKQNPKIKIIDFGRAVKVDGKPNYEHLDTEAQEDAFENSLHIAPEVVQGKSPYSSYSEVYALGFILLILSEDVGGFLRKLAKSCVRKDPAQRPSLDKLLTKLESHMKKKRY